MINLSQPGLLISWIVMLLLLLLEISSILNKRLRNYFKKHPKIWDGMDSWLCVLILLLAEKYMAWWWAGAIALACTIFLSKMMDRKK